MSENERFTWGYHGGMPELNYIQIEDNGKPMIIIDACKLMNELHEENQQLKQVQQDYEDNVANWFIENWDKLSDEQKSSAHLELGIEEDFE